MSQTSSSNTAANENAPAAASTATVEGRYAEALFDLAKDDGALEKVETELKALSSAIAENAEFRSFLRSPVYDRADQTSAMNALAEKFGFSQTTTNFLKLVSANGRLHALERMIAAFFALAAAARGEVSAEAISAAPLSDDQRKALRMEIESMVGKAVNLTMQVDPALLGGLVVKVGSRMIDTSLRAKLNKLRTVMKEAS